MLLPDVIRSLGDQPLKAFPWGSLVRDTVNLFAGVELRVTLDSTGIEICRTMMAMPSDKRDLLNQAQLDLSRAIVTTPVGGGMVVEHADTEPEADVGLRFTRSDYIAAVVVGSVVGTALFMLSQLEINRGTDWGAVKDIIMSIVKLFWDDLT